MGKSTLFRALTKKAVPAENYPFTTIDPNVGVVEVPDSILPKLAKVSQAKKIVPAIVEFVDIAGLVKNAHQGEGLGNKFLANIRDVAAIAHVVRVFVDTKVIHVENRVDPKADVEIIEAELALADLEVVKKRIENLSGKAKSGDKAALAQLPILADIESQLAQGKNLLTLLDLEEPAKLIKEMNLLTGKPVIYVANVAESEIAKAEQIQTELAKSLNQPAKDFVVISAKIEAELAELSDEEGLTYMQSLGLKEPGLHRLIHQAFTILGLQTFYTSGEMESKAWTIKQGMTAPQAAGVIHSDFEKNFIRAEIIDCQDFIKYGEAGCKEKGLLRIEGRDYVMRPGDVAHFRVGV